jgi:hypothetical protein
MQICRLLDDNFTNALPQSAGGLQAATINGP